MLDGINVTAVLKREAQLPCNITPPTDNDKPHLIFWYREISGSPFYSLDLRDKPLDSGKHVLGDDVRNRMVFRTQPNPAYLLIHEVEESDEGSYRCRVDFRSSPTRYFVVNLTVIVPPISPSILDERGLELGSVVGPYNEGSTLFISCEAKEGWPPPAVTWWRGDILMNGNYEVTSLGIVRNDLVVPALSREHFGATFTCKASNTNLTKPMETSINLDMNCKFEIDVHVENVKPLGVKIHSPRRSLSAGRRYKLQCRSFGSRPLPIMAWWMGDQRLKNTEETTSSDENITTSVLNFKPTSADYGKYLSCRAENPAIQKSGIEDGWTLDIHFIPIVTLELGPSQNKDNIHEGDDVFFECRITANPFAHAVEWKFQNQYLVNNATAGIIINNQSLVIQSAQRNSIGSYKCIAINSEGETQSNVFQLRVKHFPICKTNQITNYGVAKNEAAHILCQVVAYPDKLTYRWAFNHTSHRIPSVTNATESTLLFIPRSELDFGTLMCWATNEIGTQIEPCFYHVIAAGIPDPVYNCTVYNETESSLYVECREGYNGGLMQNFILEINNAITRELKWTFTNPRPLFYVSGLQSGTTLTLNIYASNLKGRSEPVVMNARTRDLVDNSEDNGILALTPILGVLIGVVSALSIVAIAIVIIMRCKVTQIMKQKRIEREKEERSSIPLRKDVDETGDGDEKCPDLIPSSNSKEDQEFPPVEVKCLRNQQSYSQNPYQLENSLPRQTHLPAHTIRNTSDPVQYHNEMSNLYQIKETESTDQHPLEQNPLEPLQWFSPAHKVVSWKIPHTSYGHPEEDVETPLMSNHIPLQQFANSSQRTSVKSPMELSHF
uniref:Ig-like domain-containing protein n=1 Tax=Strigamia maritima TaxID=126957 RepID=T1IV98_STRMM